MAPMLAITQLASDSVSDDDLDRLRRYEAGPRSRFDRLHEIDRIDDNMPNVRRESFIGQKIAALGAEHEAERAKIESELEGFGYNPTITMGRIRVRARRLGRSTISARRLALAAAASLLRRRLSARLHLKQW